MKEYYNKNPLTDKQNSFMDKFNRLHQEMIKYYHFSEGIIFEGEFLWEEPELWLPILDIGKLGFEFKLSYSDKIIKKVYDRKTMRAAVEFLADKFPLYVPFYILSMGLVINLSPMATCSFSLPYGYSIKAVVEDINKNLTFIRAVNKSTNQMFLDAEEKTRDADIILSIRKNR